MLLIMCLGEKRKKHQRETKNYFLKPLSLEIFFFLQKIGIIN